MQLPYSFLTPWLERRVPLASFIDLERIEPNRELGGFLAIQRAIPIHESVELAAESLSSSWEKVDAYVKQALEIIRAEEPQWLDSWETEQIQEQLGPPPVNCLPIYLVSVGEGNSERLVYIGKTSSAQGRFKGGHTAFTKLHHPKFDGLKKTLYLAAVVLLSEQKECLPLEWVKPLAKAEELLGYIEAQCIFEFKPELNIHHVSYDNSRWPTTLHIQNVTGVSSFLDNKVCWPCR